MSREGSAPMSGAPGGGVRSISFLGEETGLPAVDDRLAPPETRVEYLHGQEIYAPPRDEAHARQHSCLNRIISAHVREPYAVAISMLTRTDGGSDFAADLSVYKAMGDVEGDSPSLRELEEIAFLLADRDAAAIPTRKAMALSARGVRRIFAVFTMEQALGEWSSKEGCWERIQADGAIEDACFVRPISVNAIVDWRLVDDEVMKALLAKRSPVIMEALAAERARQRQNAFLEGQLSVQRESVLRVLEARGVPISERVRTEVMASRDTGLLDQWLCAALTVADADQLFS